MLTSIKRLESKLEVIIKLMFSCTGKSHFTSLFNTMVLLLLLIY